MSDGEGGCPCGFPFKVTTGGIRCRSHEERDERLVVFYCQRFGEEVSKVVCALAPFDNEVALAHPVAYPVVAHVDRFGPFQLNGVIGESYCAGIVAVDERGRLWVSERCGDSA